MLGRGSGEPDDLACDTQGGPHSCGADEVPGVPAAVRAYWLDRFEVTVGRFRNFVSAVVQGWLPSPGSGKHGYLNGGTELGWDPSLTLPTTPSGCDSVLSCASESTWTAAVGTSENRPINCVDWPEAYAFCIWDGGFLPTEAEWELAAAGDGRWGHADLAGNLWEWNPDWYAARTGVSADFANLAPGSFRVDRGGSFNDLPAHQRAANRQSDPTYRDGTIGFRCAKAASQ